MALVSHQTAGGIVGGPPMFGASSASASTLGKEASHTNGVKNNSNKLIHGSVHAVNGVQQVIHNCSASLFTNV